MDERRYEAKLHCQMLYRGSTKLKNREIIREITIVNVKTRHSVSHQLSLRIVTFCIKTLRVAVKIN